ncbi:conserved hypothetical protein [Burkholderia pseudomallei 668]|nr:conserved hypothetical protein [Burkholderia pseudomallei 668]
MGVRHGLTGSVLRRGHRARTARRDTAAIRPSARRSARRAPPLLPCIARHVPRPDRPPLPAPASIAIASEPHRRGAPLYPPVLRIRAAHPLADRVRQPILGSLEGIRAHRIGREHHVGRAVVLHDPREIVERNRDRTGGRPIRPTAQVRPAERPASRMRGCARPGADATPMQHRRNTNESIQSCIESNSSALRGAPIPFI